MKDDGNTIYSGQLEIDHAEGTITFVSEGQRILRVTHLRKPIPVNMSIDLASVAQLTSFTSLRAEEVDIIDKLVRKTDLDSGPDPRVCSTCGKEHQLHRRVNVQAAGAFLYPGHEYIIETKTPRQKYPRVWRMGFLERGQMPNSVQFSARGPDRTHDGQYGGTVTLLIDEITHIQQVPRVEAERHVGRQIR